MLKSCSAFLRPWDYRHGLRKVFKAVNKYDNDEFRSLCEDWDIGVNIAATSHYKANGIIERANCSIQIIYNQLQVTDRCSRLDDITMEATYGKSLVRGSKAG